MTLLYCYQTTTQNLNSKHLSLGRTVSYKPFLFLISKKGTTKKINYEENLLKKIKNNKYIYTIIVFFTNTFYILDSYKIILDCVCMQH